MTIAERHQLANQPSDDARLTEALAVLAREPISVLSIDIFDTLMWRVVPKPVDAFLLLGRRLRELGHLAGHLSPEVFWRLRLKAEERARQAVLTERPSGEVSLEAIYEQMPRDLLGGLTPDDLCAMEVDLEREITFPDLDVVKVARLAREKCGARVVLVSDTYYSERQLRHILDREPFADVGLSRIFTSSHYGVGKATGLYQVVLDALDVSPEHLLHLGDHDEADVAFPAKVGIRTVHFPKLAGDMGTILNREGLVGQSQDPPSALVDPVRGDCGLTALRSKAAFRSQGAGLAPGISSYWQSGASVLGPVFTGFAEWVHGRAREEGVSTVYCIMREGEFLARLVNGARGYLGSAVAARPIWLSRQVCARASLFSASAEELSTFLNRRRPPTLTELCDALGISLMQLPEVFNDGEGRLDDPDLWQRTVDSITSRPEVQAVIVSASARLRERLVEHFVATVGPDAGRVVLADLGWGGTIQAYLNTALAGAGVDVDTVGLYLLTHDAAVDRMLDGVKMDGYLASGGVPEQGVRWIIRSPEVLEQACMTDAGSITDFKPDGEPLTGPVNESSVQMLQRVAVQGGILAFQSEWARYADVVPAKSRTLDDSARALLLRILSRFVISPTIDEARMFGSWSHDENFGSEGTEPVLVREMVPLLKYMTPAQYVSLPMQKLYWGFGLATLYHPPLAQAAAAIAEGRVPPEAFSLGEQRHVVISLDSLGLSSRLPARLSGRLMTPVSRLVSLLAGTEARRRCPVRAVGEGMCFLREEIQSEPIRGVQIEFPAGPGVVRLDRMSLTFSLSGRPEPVRVEVEWPSQYRAVTYTQCRALAPNLLFGPRRSPRVTYVCPREWGAGAYKVEVELAFAWLPTAPASDGTAGRMEALYDMGEKVGGRVARLVRRAGQA